MAGDESGSGAPEAEMEFGFWTSPFRVAEHGAAKCPVVEGIIAVPGCQTHLSASIQVERAR